MKFFFLKKEEIIQLKRTQKKLIELTWVNLLTCDLGQKIRITTYKANKKDKDMKSNFFLKNIP